jgi:hypothetical protein
MRLGRAANGLNALDSNFDGRTGEIPGAGDNGANGRQAE